MVFSDFHFYSKELQLQTSTYVLLPDPPVVAQSPKPVPTLYLLHGLSDDHTMWLRQSRVEHYARKYRVAVVMPAANRSFYMNMVSGPRYDSFIAEELPEVMERYYPLSHQRDGRIAAGLSMGGYGALKLGLSRPDRYAAVASLSGPVEMEEVFFFYTDPAALNEMKSIYGSATALKGGVGSLHALAQKLLKTPERAPRIYMACGTEDFFIGNNAHFADTYQDRLPIEYHALPGEHNWDFWDRQLQEVLRWLPLEPAEDVW